MKRRNFLKLGTSAAVAPFFLSGYQSIYSNAYASRIVTVKDDMASHLDFIPGRNKNESGIIIDKVQDFSFDYERIYNMVDHALMRFTNKKTAREAWESLFPEGKLSEKTRIGIKVNFAYGWQDDRNDWNLTACPFGPKAAITEAIISGLTQMLDGFFPIENITVYDLGLAIIPGKANAVIQGYRPVHPNDENVYADDQPGAYKLHWLNARNEKDVPDDAPGFLAAPDYPEPYHAPQKILPPVYENDFMINVGVAKDHRSAGVTGVMKNTFGCTDKCANTHGNEWMNIDTPYAGTRNCVPVFYKTINEYSPCILNIIDALAGMYDGGPTAGRIFPVNTIAVSKDPVALDHWLMQLLNKARIRNGCSRITLSDGRAEDGHPNAPSLRIAAEKHQLGSLSLDDMINKDLDFKGTGYDIPELAHAHYRMGNIHYSGNKCHLTVRLDRSGRRQQVQNWIQDLEGNRVRSFGSSITRLSEIELEWNLKDDSGKAVEEGLYVWHIEMNGIMHTRTVNLLT